MKIVYLAGPITGLSHKGCTDWRHAAVEELALAGIRGLSPMRAKDYLAAIESISGHGREYVHMNVMSTPRSVTTRDRFDTQRADLVLLNLTGAKAPSIGSMIEIGWADSARVPIVCAIEPEGNPHDHMMVSELIGFRVPTLAEALQVCKAILV